MDKKEFGEIVDLVSKVIVVTPQELSEQLEERENARRAKELETFFCVGITDDKLTLEDLADVFSRCAESGMYQESKHYIEDLKKQIKHSKNPLEIKQLNKKLNAAYKEMGKRR